MKNKLPLIGICLGIIYGFLARIIYGEANVLASVSFFFLIPAMLGIIPLMFADDEKIKSYTNIIFLPWCTLLGLFAFFMVTKVEQLACLLFLALPFLLISTVAAFFYRLYRINQKRKRERKIYSLLLMPFLVVWVEDAIFSPSEEFHVVSQVVIDSDKQIVWNNIVEVDSIRETEYSSGFFHYAGIPRPISATVNNWSLGARRTGHFEGGLQFDENITEYSPNEKISFNIKVNPESIGDDIFQQHVLKGNYFSFVSASYQLKSTPQNKTLLFLHSSYRLTSKINFYGKFWGDLVLEDFQNRLLDVIKKRAEQADPKLSKI